MTVVERVTKFTVSQQVEGKTAQAVTKATIALLKPLKGVVRRLQQTMVKSFPFMRRLVMCWMQRFILRIHIVHGSVV